MVVFVEMICKCHLFWSEWNAVAHVEDSYLKNRLKTIVLSD